VVHWFSPVVTGKPAGKKAQTTVCKKALASGLKIGDVGIVRSLHRLF